MNGEPLWIPTSDDGTSWKLLSWKGKLLGELVKVGAVFIADRTCCRVSMETSWRSLAVAHIEATFRCEPCAVRRIQKDLAK